MVYTLSLGAVVLRILSQRPLECPAAFDNFRLPDETPAQVTAHISWDWAAARRPHTDPVGQDMLLVYYREGDTAFCELKGGDRGALTSAWWQPDFSRIYCTVNTVTCPVSQDTIPNVLRMLPMRALLLHFGVLCLHASQVAWQGMGIVFSAASGTGKTTQANLWHQYIGAEVICNDRTLLRRVEGRWQTYGYPFDGSQPVRSGGSLPLGCIALPRRNGDIPAAVRLRPGKALPLLMENLVMDVWDADARTKAAEQLIELLEEVPVFLLDTCPDERAVAALERQLREEGVIPHG
ncbi:MAG: hypothetical protein ACI3W5_09290 [Faecousia sp.]